MLNGISTHFFFRIFVYTKRSSSSFSSLRDTIYLFATFFPLFYYETRLFLYKIFLLMNWCRYASRWTVNSPDYRRNKVCLQKVSTYLYFSCHLKENPTLIKSIYLKNLTIVHTFHSQSFKRVSDFCNGFIVRVLATCEVTKTLLAGYNYQLNLRKFTPLKKAV